MSEALAVGSARRVADELLAAVDAQRRAELRQLELVCELVDCYGTVDSSPVPGASRLVASGGDGTPPLDEFCVNELAALLRLSEASAWALIRDAINLRERHPQAWASVLLGLCPVWQARRVARACAELSAEAASWVDVRVGPALGRLPWTRLRRKLAGHIVAADKELALAKAARARRDRFVSIRHTGEGTSWLVGLLSTPDAVRLQDAVGAISRDLLSDPTYAGSPGEARADALGLLAVPSPTASRPRGAGAGAGVRVLPRPEATLVVHVARETLAGWVAAPTACPGSGGAGPAVQPGAWGRRGPRGPLRATGVARVEGPGGLDDVGPLLGDQVRDLLGHARVRVLPVIDLEGEPAVDAYEIPDRIRTQVALRDTHSRFPYSTRAARGCDVDHTVPYQRGGAVQTRPGNLGALDRTAHRAKTHGAWRLDQPHPGVFDWTSPLGYRYRVDAHGSRPISQITEATIRTKPLRR